ncbi:hypothetical protein ABW636_17210 [Aquimarina sp. 2201CG1-2-11]|uniref:hypothetical protein n=1 Tax=Aquimarina discodermiae TaxID=3231043 RepID=UPI0034622BBD
MNQKKFNVTELEERLEFCSCPDGYKAQANPAFFHDGQPIACVKSPWVGHVDIIPCQ